mgnify:CR=1 FL=1
MAILLQFLLQVAIKIEHYTDSFFKNTSSKKDKILRITSTLVVLFISKIAIMEAINIVFGKSVVFGGIIHGIITFIIVVITIIVAEQILLKIYRSLS